MSPLSTRVAERLRAERAAEASRAASSTSCPRCGAPTLTGLDEDVAAAPVTVDEAPCAYLAAVCAVLAGRGVVARTRSAAAGKRGDLHRLDVTQLANGGPRLPLHLEHQCQSGVTSGAASGAAQ